MAGLSDYRSEGGYAHMAGSEVPTNYYRVLGVPRDANPNEISDAYKKILLAMQNGEYIPNSRKELSDAYYVLSNRSRRAEYDQMLSGPSCSLDATRIFNWETENSLIEVIVERDAGSQTTLSAGGYALLNDPVEHSAQCVRSAVFGKLEVADPSPFAGYYENHASGAFPTRRAGQTGQFQGRSVAEIIAKRERRINTLLFGIGIGSPIATAIGVAVLYLIG